MAAALDELPDTAVLVFDLDLRFVVARGAALSANRTPTADLEGRLAVDALAPARWAYYRPLYLAALRGEHLSVETGSPDGARRFLVRLGPVRGPGGDIIGGASIAVDVTDQHHVLESLALSEERFRLLAENSSDLVMRSTPDGVIEWVSHSVTEVLGWKPQDLVGRNSVELAHPDVLAGMRRDISQVNAGGTVSGRVRVRCADGSFRWMYRRMRPILGSDGAVVARVSGWQDVQAQVDAERALAASEEQFRLAMDMASIGMAIASQDGYFLRVNPALCRMLGLTKDELEGRHFADVTHPDDVARGRLAHQSIADGSAEQVTQRTRYLTRSGNVVWVDVSVAAIREPGGALRHSVMQAVDVTAEVRNHEALQRTVRRFRMLAENASDVVYQIDAQGIIEWVSPSVTAELGWDPEELVGTPASGLLDPVDIAAAGESREGVLAGEGPASLQLRFRHLDGSTRWMSTVARPLHGEEGRVLGAVVGLHDITAEHAAREELAYRASHDVLTGVSNRDDLMLRLRDLLEHNAAERSIGVLFCDVDNLKAINDRYGHHGGDLVLSAVADRLTAGVRRQDVVARLGGDEFVVVLDGVADIEALAAIAVKCQRAASEPVTVERDEIAVTLSVGAVLAGPDDDPDALLARADRAVYRAKQAGRNLVSLDGA
jgi:diguanylate cyclase (GGDEF)-like protein/PAS domain S-box-containing protein